MVISRPSEKEEKVSPEVDTPETIGIGTPPVMTRKITEMEKYNQL